MIDYLWDEIENISTVKKLREFLTNALRLPLESLRIQINDVDVAQNKTLQHLFTDEFSKGIKNASNENCRLSYLKQRISRQCGIQKRFINFYKKNCQTKYKGNKKIKNLRKDWKYKL